MNVYVWVLLLAWLLQLYFALLFWKDVSSRFRSLQSLSDPNLQPRPIQFRAELKPHKYCKSRLFYLTMLARLHRWDSLEDIRKFFFIPGENL